MADRSASQSSYSFDGIELLGTGGALKQALPLLGDDFFVLNGDSYVPCSFARIQSAYEAARRPALMTVLRNDNRWDKSNVLFRNGELIEYDKESPRFDMSHIDFGLSVFSSDMFLTIPRIDGHRSGRYLPGPVDEPGSSRPSRSQNVSMKSARRRASGTRKSFLPSRSNRLSINA